MMTRRTLLRTLAAAAGAAATAPLLRRAVGSGRAIAEVHVLRAPTYAAVTAAAIAAAVPRDHLPRIRGRRVLLKPNLIEYRATQPIHTDPRLVRAAIEAFGLLGAADVTVAEGPGHRRDTDFLLAVSGLGEAVRDAGVRFVDLNLDETSIRTIPGRRLSGLARLHLPRTVTDADYVVSMPKMKTHHLVGITVSLKNVFGMLPGAIYGWPKNFFHFRGVPGSILDANRTIAPDLALVDGVVGMEGDGPLNGRGVASGVVVVGADLASVDATCCRLMGLRPEGVGYLVQAAAIHGPIHAAGIRVVGPPLASLVHPFRPASSFPQLADRRWPREARG
jgi:uncharacterized protein (DUF362 family)